ncbi:hypothetical protein M3P19_01670 [Muricauda sp. 2012CJ35-5]|uniref:Lipoprotein n=1 Tax=Flagellimonas spongiicola TaxID=2942208 RepID=A0ABT0PMW5_9FLAO|nr:hypothetical protein [Allomuricauda spongiicola]MCL6272693.1 hypothetical protein [Allomuricauda spongiicola]
MRTQIKILIFIALVVLIALSCSKEEVSNPEEFKVAKQQVQFDFNTTEEPQEEDQNQFNATISSVDPLVIESEELEIFTYLDHETNTHVEGVVKIGTSSNLEADNGEPCEEETIPGYLFNPQTSCFHSGYYKVFPDCNFIFFTYPFQSPVFCLSDVANVLH